MSSVGLITIDNLGLNIDGQWLIRALSGQFLAGQLIAITGCNGSGKTSLLRLLAGLNTPDIGKITVQGGAKNIAFLVQSQNMRRDIPIEVADFVASGLDGFGQDRSQETGAPQRLDDILRNHDLTALRHRLIGALSMGEFGRAQFARLSVADKPILILDEPFANLDSGRIDQMLAQFKQWAKEGRCVIVALHHSNLIDQFDVELNLQSDGPIWRVPKAQSHQHDDCADPHCGHPTPVLVAS